MVWSVTFGLELFAIPCGRNERFVRIKRFDLQYPIVVTGMAINKIAGTGKTLSRGKVAIIDDPFAVRHIVQQHRSRRQVLRVQSIILNPRIRGRAQRRGPFVALLPTVIVITVVLGVVVARAILKVMQMVRDQMRIDTSRTKRGKNRHIEWLKRAPASVQKRQTTGVNIAPCRHARQAAYIVIVKSDRSFGEPPKIRCVNTISAIGLNVIAVQRIEDDKYRAHQDGAPNALKAELNSVTSTA